METKLLEIKQFLRDFDAEWSQCPVERRQLELRQAERERARKEREAREQQQQAANNLQSSRDAIDQRIDRACSII